MLGDQAQLTTPSDHVFERLLDAGSVIGYWAKALEFVVERTSEREDVSRRLHKLVGALEGTGTNLRRGKSVAGTPGQLTP